MKRQLGTVLQQYQRFHAGPLFNAEPPRHNASLRAFLQCYLITGAPSVLRKATAPIIIASTVMATSPLERHQDHNPNHFNRPTGYAPGNHLIRTNYSNPVGAFPANQATLYDQSTPANVAKNTAPAGWTVIGQTSKRRYRTSTSRRAVYHYLYQPTPHCRSASDPSQTPATPPWEAGQPAHSSQNLGHGA